MTASAWNPQAQTIPLANANGTMRSEQQVASLGQRTFTIESFAYTPNTGSLLVCKDGKLLSRGNDYFEVDGTTVLLANGVEADGLKMQFIAFVGITANVTTDTQLRADLLANNGATNVKNIQNVAGANTRTVAQELNDITLVVTRFGADPTGAADSTAAVQAAVKAAMTIANNNQSVNQQARRITIKYPPGQYLINGTVLTAMNITHIGDGATIIVPQAGFAFDTGYVPAGSASATNLVSNSALSDADAINNCLSGVRFENLTFYGGDTAIRARAALWDSGVFGCKFYKVRQAVNAVQCFYFDYESLTIRDDSTVLPKVPAIFSGRATNRVRFSRISIVNRDQNISIGETGTANTSAQISIKDCSFESGNNGILLTGNINTFTMEDIYIENISSVLYDTDGALKYNFKVNNFYIYSSAYAVDLSGLRDSIIGEMRDSMASPYNKSIVRLRQGTNGNQATVQISNIGDDFSNYNTVMARYQLSDGVKIEGNFVKNGTAPNRVVYNQNKTVDAATDGIIPIYDRGWYGKVDGFIVGSDTGVIHNTAGTEMYINTNFHFDEYSAKGFAIKVMPNAGSGAGGTNPNPIYLKGITCGSHNQFYGDAGYGCYASMNSQYNTLMLHFTGFGTSNTDPNYAWMRNGQFTAEGIIKLMA